MLKENFSFYKKGRNMYKKNIVLSSHLQKFQFETLSVTLKFNFELLWLF